MERLSKEDYREAKGCLKRYNYNCINIINTQSDILSLSIAPVDGLPKAPYSVGNPTLKKVMQLEQDEDLQKSIREYNAVIQALYYINDKITEEIFNEEFRKGEKNKWTIIDTLHISEDIYKRRKKELIYRVDKELKSLKEKN